MKLTHLLVVLVIGLCAFAGLAQQPATPQQSATPVGKEACSTCHGELVAQFDRSPHGRLADFELQGQYPGCEACHGAGSLHAESADATLIRSFKPDDEYDGSKACLSCHQQDAAMDWVGSEHSMSDVACTDCHRIHQSRQVVSRVAQAEGMRTFHSTAPPPRGSLKKPEPQLCFDCHREERAKFLYTSHHPLREGHMTCSSCHAAHGSPAGMVHTEERVNDLCLRCHSQYQGPFIFEHAPVEENCLACHDPHGTLANNLLKQNEPYLCLQCHEMHFHNARTNPTSPVFLPSGGSTNPLGTSGFQQGFGTKCTACHIRIHGSDLPSQSTSGQGKSLTR